MDVAQEPQDLAESISKNLNHVPSQWNREEIQIASYHIKQLTDEQFDMTIDEIWQLLLTNNPYLSITSFLMLVGFKYHYDLSRGRIN